MELFFFFVSLLGGILDQSQELDGLDSLDFLRFSDAGVGGSDIDWGN